MPGVCSTGASDWWTPPRANLRCSTSGRRNGSPPTSSWSSFCWQSLAGHTTSSPAAATGPGRRRALIVKTVEEFALSQTDDHLYVSDLCRVAGVSERTLEYAFKEVMGLTPVTYLIRLRLHRVRRALLAATQGTTTVSIEALDWGFWHFGEFSRAYKDCFGELPSDTLRRRPGEPPA